MNTDNDLLFESSFTLHTENEYISSSAEKENSDLTL